MILFFQDSKDVKTKNCNDYGYYYQVKLLNGNDFASFGDFDLEMM